MATTNVNPEVLKALEAMLGGGAKQRNGRSVQPKGDKPQMEAGTVADLLAGRSAAPADELNLTNAVSETCNGKLVTVGIGTIYGVTAVKVKGMPFKKDFFSLDTIRLMASEEFHVLLNQFLEELPSK